MTEARQLRFWLISLLVFAVLLWLLGSVLAPFLTGMAIAYGLDPATGRLERLGVRRWLATTFVLLLFALVLIGFLLLLIPLISSQVQELIAALPRYVAAINDRIQALIERLRAYFDAGDLERVRSSAGSVAQSALGWVGTVLGGLWAGGMAVIDVVSFVLITPIVAFYFLRDWNRIVDQIDSLLPRSQTPTIRALAKEVDRTLAAFIRGQLLVCLTLGAFYAIALTAAGLQFGLLVGLISGALSFIPFVGSFTGFIAAVGIALVQFDSWVMWLVIAGIFVFGQVVEGNFLTPKVVGQAIGLHPVWVIFALLAGGSLFGFTGVLLAVPVAAIIGVLVRFAIQRYRESPYYRGRTALDPVPIIGRKDAS